MTKTDIQLRRHRSGAPLGIPDQRRPDWRHRRQGSRLTPGSRGHVSERYAAEDATKRVSGVRTIAQDLKVNVPYDHKRDDSDIAGAVQNAFKWDVFVPKTVTATVREGSVTLTGEVTWNYQRDAAEKAIRFLTGVVAVYNSITLKPQAAVDQVKEKVEAALLRQARSDAKSIHIETSGGRVTLTGQASSWQSVQDAAGAAWAAPGVTEVVDKIAIAN